MKKSRSLSIRTLTNKLSSAATVIYEDKISVYAAQASFFIIISSIPFIMLLFSLSRYVISDKIYDFIIAFGQTLPAGAKDFYMEVTAELYARPAIKLISLSAVTTFWSASRGMAAVRGGISTVYRSNPNVGFIKNMLLSLLYTAVFIVTIIALIVLLLFGELINENLASKFAVIAKFGEIFKYRNVIFFILLTLFFACLYYILGRKGFGVGRKFRNYLPGAALASAGWILFSYFYSLYAMYFSRASYIYGSLTAIVLLMLWLYACMNILFLGAEFNKLIGIKKKRE